jgi:hypothetical protein
MTPCPTCAALKARLAQCETDLALTAEIATRNRDEAHAVSDRLVATEARLAEALIELNGASPIETCQGCGTQDRRHRMMIEEGDRWECTACWDKYNAIDAARAGEGEGHASDCAVHNAPALPVGPCNCGRKP